MQGPADTLSYMIAGYTVFFVVLAAYLVSLVMRWRNLRQDETMLQELKQPEKPGQVTQMKAPTPLERLEQLKEEKK